jgi:predicted dinucleotide-binding enzyme
LGGIGKTGRRIADRLAARGVPVRIRSRSAPSPFGARSRPGER